MDRKTFLGMAGAGAGLALPRRVRDVLALEAGPRPRRPQTARHDLPSLTTVSGEGLTLTARPSTADIGVGRSEVWSLNGSFPAPTIRLRRGARANMRLLNDLEEPTILHWHGLDVPPEADGHPRLAIDPGSSYDYDFAVGDRAGTYWYHPHTHGRTAAQTYMGLAGLLIVEDDEEDALGLPSGDFEIPLVLQDKRLGGSTALSYELSMGPDMMMGYFGDTAFGNGVANPTRVVDRALYRLRILNASNARIFDLVLGGGETFTLIGTDGGLLESPARVDRLMLATGERADVLVDFSSRSPGDRVVLRSSSFDVPGMMAGMMGMMRGRGMRGGMGRRGTTGGLAQGAAMELVEFVVGDGPRQAPASLPARLSEIPRRPVDGTTRGRTFRFDSMMMNHTINGRTFEMARVDERVPLGRTEVWTLVNGSELPHPVHVHAGQMRVLSRTGGRGRVMPWETGLKDTVLLFPQERVDVAVRFDDHPGLFLLHCHNLEHEDQGMMLNFEVVE